MKQKAIASSDVHIIIGGIGLLLLWGHSSANYVIYN